MTTPTDQMDYEMFNKKSDLSNDGQTKNQNKDQAQ
jgi:hypothetical protein